MKYLSLVVALTTLSTPALALPISFTGAEFASLPGITFPTGTRTIIGDSLRIDGTSTQAVVASLPLDQFGLNPGGFEVQFNITRLLRDDGNTEQNPFIYLSDGFNLFGATFIDTVEGFGAQIRRDELDSDGQSLNRIEFLGTSPITPVAINSDYLATISIEIGTDGTTITGDVNNGAVRRTASTTTVFDPGNGAFSLVLGSNSFTENYIINSVTFREVSTVTAVVEPGAFGGMGLGLLTLGLGLYRRRFG